MKSTTLMALAVAGTFACGGAIAEPLHFGGSSASNTHGSSYEAVTPSSVDESAPWLANQAHSAGWTSGSSMDDNVVGLQQGVYGDESIGASSSMGGSGSGGFDSLSMGGTQGYDASIYGLDYSLNDSGGVDYWLLGDESSSATGASSSAGGSGSGGYDSMSSSFEQSSSFDQGQSFDQSSLGSDELGASDYYMISGPLSQFNPSTAPVYEATADDIELLSSPPEGVWVISPIYDSIVDPVAALEGTDTSQQLSQYRPLGSDEDPLT